MTSAASLILLVLLGSPASARSTSFERAALIFTHPTPDTGVLTRLQGPLETGVHHGAPAADTLGLLDLQEGRAGVAYGEKQLRVLIEARCAVTPIHADQSLHSWETR